MKNGFLICGIAFAALDSFGVHLHAQQGSALVGERTEPAKSFTMLVGTYTEGKSKGIYVFRLNADTGDLQPLASPAETVNPSPDGKFLYASNRANANELVIYSVDAKAGTLALAGRQTSLGRKPRDFCIDPTGKFLVVANQDSDNLVIFKRDPRTGALSPTGRTMEVGSPVCVKMVPAP